MIRELTLKNVITFEGRDGYGLNATIYADGKKIAFAIDEGCGGEMHFRYEGKTPEERRANEAALKAFVDAYPSEPKPDDCEAWEASLYANGLRKLDLDDIIGRIADAAENEKRMVRFRKTYVLFTTPDCKKDEFRKIAHKGNVEAAKAHVLKHYPGAKFL